MAVEDGEAEEVSSTLNQPPELQEPKASSLTSTVRKFHPAWKNVYIFGYSMTKKKACDAQFV